MRFQEIACSLLWTMEAGEQGAEDVTFRGGAKEMSWLQMRWGHDPKLGFTLMKWKWGMDSGRM